MTTVGARRGFFACWTLLVALSVTGLASDIAALNVLRLELLAAAGVFAFAALLLVRNGPIDPLDRKFLTYWAPASTFLFAMLVSEFFSGRHLGILTTSLFRHLAKAYLLVPLILAVPLSKEARLIVVRTFAWSVSGLAVWALFQWTAGGRAVDPGRLWVEIRHGDPNFLSTYFGASLMLYGFLFSEDPGKRRITGIADLFGVTALAVGLLATESRMGLLTVAFCGGLYVLWRLPRVKAMMVLALGGLGLFVFVAVSGIEERLAILEDPSVLNRVGSIQAGIAAFFQKPWTGWGVDSTPSYLYEFSRFPLFQSLENRISLHNTWFQVLAELGLFGFAAFSLLWGVVLYRLLLSLREGSRQSLWLLLAWLVCVLNMNALPLAYDDTLATFPVILLSAMSTGDRGPGKRP